MSASHPKIKLNTKGHSQATETKENATYLHQDLHLSHMGAVHKNNSNTEPRAASKEMTRELARMADAAALENKNEPRAADQISRSTTSHTNGGYASHRPDRAKERVTDNSHIAANPQRQTNRSQAQERSTGNGHITADPERQTDRSQAQGFLDKYSMKKWYDSEPTSEQPWTAARAQQSTSGTAATRYLSQSNNSLPH